MKATIKKDGYLVIKAETELESYALGKWFDDNFNRALGSAALVLDRSLDQDGTNDNIKKDEESNNLF